MIQFESTKLEATLPSLRGLHHKIGDEMQKINADSDSRVFKHAEKNDLL